MLINYEVKTEHVGGFMVKAERMSGFIYVQFIDGTGLRDAEDFTVEESGIHTKEMLQSYCEARLAQWKRNNWQKT